MTGIQRNFLISFMVDARGGAMRGCRHPGVRVIIPPRKCCMPTRVTCRLITKEKLTKPPPLLEGEGLAARIIEMGPVGTKFLGPVLLEVPHFASLRGKEREVVILRSDNGESWYEHPMQATEDAITEALGSSSEGGVDGSQASVSSLWKLDSEEDVTKKRIKRILTSDLPMYFALVSRVTRVKQESTVIGMEGGVLSSNVVPQVQAVLPEGTLTRPIPVGLQAQPIAPELVAKLLGNRVAVSPIVTIEPRRRKFHKPITLTIPVPRAAQKGMINQYGGERPTLRLLFSLAADPNPAVWEDVTETKPMTLVDDCVSFTTTVSARFWLIDCQNVAEAAQMASILYQEAVTVPYMARFVVFAKRDSSEEGKLRIFCMTDDKDDKTLEKQEKFFEVARSRDIEVLEGRPQFVEMAGNLIPVTKSGDQLHVNFKAFRENRLSCTVKVRDQDQDAAARVAFMKEPKVARGEAPQTPICNLNIRLPDMVLSESGELDADRAAEIRHRHDSLRAQELVIQDTINQAEMKLSDIADTVQGDWVVLAQQLQISISDINHIKNDYKTVGDQALAMLHFWVQKSGDKATGTQLENALRRINRDDVVRKCLHHVVRADDAVEAAAARVAMDQSGFDTFKEEVGITKDSLKRGMSLDVQYDEQDMIKESESAAEDSPTAVKDHLRDELQYRAPRATDEAPPADWISTDFVEATVYDRRPCAPAPKLPGAEDEESRLRKEAYVDFALQLDQLAEIQDSRLSREDSDEQSEPSVGEEEIVKSTKTSAEEAFPSLKAGISSEPQEQPPQLKRVPDRPRVTFSDQLDRVQQEDTYEEYDRGEEILTPPPSPTDKLEAEENSDEDEDAQEMTEIVETYRISEDGNVWKTIQKTTVITTNGSTERIVVLKEEPVLATETNIAEAATRLASSADVQGDSEDKYGHPKTEREVMYSRAEIVPREVTSSYEGVQQVVSESSGQVLSPVSDGGSSYHDEPSPVPEPTLPEDFRIDELAYERPEDEDDDDVVHKEEFYSERHEDLLPQKDVYRAADYSRSSDVKTYPVHIVSANYEDLQEQVLVVDSTSQAEADDSQWKVADTFIKVSHVDEDFPGAQDYPESEYTDENAVIAQSELDDSQVASAASSVLAPAAFVGEQETGRSSVEDLDSRSKVVGAFTSSEQINKEVEEEIKAVKSEDLSTQGDLPAHMEVVSEGNPEKEETEVEEHEEILPDGTVHRIRKVRSQTVKKIKRTMKSLDGEEEVVEEKEFIPGTIREDLVETFNEPPRMVRETEDMEQVLDDGTRVQRKIVYNRMIHRLRTHQESFDSDHGFQTEDFEIDEVIPGTESAFVAGNDTPDFSDSDDGSSPHEPEYSDENNPFDSEDFGENNPHDIQDVEQDTEATESKTTDPWEQDFAASDAVERRYQSGSFEEAEKLYLEDTTPRSYSPTLVEGQSLFPDTKSFQAEEKSQAGTEEQSLEAATASSLEYEHQQNLGTDASRRETDEQAAMNQDREDGQSYPQEWRELGDSGFAKRQVTKVTYYPDDPDTSDKLQAKDRVVVEEQEMRLEDSDFVREQLTLSQHELVEETELYKELHIADIHYELSEQVTVEEAQMLEILETREAAVVKEEQETYEIPEQQTVIVAEEMGITLVDEAVEVVSVQAAEEETVQEHIIASFTTRIDEVIEDHTEKDEFVTELADEADDVVHKEEFTEVVTKQKIEAVETEAPRHILVVESVSHPPLEETVEVVEQEDEESEQSMEKSLTDDVLEEQASKDEPESPITDLKYTSLADPATTELVREKIETIEEVVSRMERKFELTSSDAFEKTYTSSSYEKFVSDKLVHDEERVSYEHEKFVVHEEGEIGHDQDRGKEEFRSELTEDASETMQDFSEIKSELVESLESHHELDTSKEHITEPSEAEEVSKLTETKAQATDLEDQTVEDRDLGTQRDLDDMQDTLEESEQQQHTFGHLQKEERYFAVESTVTDAVEKILDEVPVDDQVTLVSNVFEKEEPEIRTAVEASEVVERQDYEPAESKLETVSYSYQDQTVSETFMDAAALDEQRFHGKAVTDELLVEPHCFTAHIISTEIEGEEDEEIDQLVSEDMVTDLQKAEADMFVDERTIQPEAALDYDEGGEEEDLREEAITESRRSASDEKTEEEISYEGKFTEGIDEELESVAATAGSDVAGAEEVDQEYLSETKDSSEPEAVDEGQTLRPSFVEQDKVMLEEDVDMDDDERKYQTEREESIEKGAQETVEIKHKAFEEEGREEEETDKACDFERELEIEHRQMGETDETQDREIEDEFEDKEIEDKYEDREIRDKDEYKEIEDKYEDSKIEDKDEHKEIEDKYEDRVIEDKYEDRVIEDKYEDRVIKDKDEDKEIEDKYEDSEIEDREVGGKDEDRNIKDKYDLEEDLLDRKHTDEISDEKEIYEEKEQTCIHEGTIPEIVEDLVTSIESSDVEAQVSSLPDEEEDEIKETIEVTKVKITHTQPDDYSEEEKEKEKSKSIEEDVAAAKDSTDMVQSAHHEDLEPLTSIEHEFSRVAGQEIAELQEDSIDAGRDISDITQSHRSFATLPDEEVEEIQEISKEEVFPSKIKETRTQLDERDALDGVVDDSSSAEKPDEDAGVEQAEDEYVSVGVKPSEHEDINLGSSYSREFEEHYTSRIVETTSSYEHRKEERHTEICMTSEFLQNSEQTVHEHEEFGETYEKETVEVTQRDEDDEYDVLGAEKGIDDKYDDWVLLNREELTENEIAQAATLVMVGRPLADDEEEEEQKDYEEERDYDIRIGEQSRDMKAYFDTDIEAPIRDKRLGEDLLDKDLIEQTVSPVEVASVSHEVDSDVVGLTKDELESSTGEVEMQRYSPTQEVESHDLQYTTNLMDVEETKEKKAMKETKSKIHHRMFIETQVESVEIEGMDASASIEQSDQDESTEIEEYAEVEKKTPPFYVADATMKVTSEEKEVSEKFESPVADMSSQQYEKGFISETTTSRVDYNMTMMTTHFASEHAEEFYVSEQDASEALLEAQSREDHKDYPKAVISDQYDISPSISLTAEECIEKAGEAERAEKSLPLPDESSESVSVSEKAIGSSPEEQENLDDDNVLDQDEEFVKDVDEGFVKDVDEEFDKDVDEFGKDVGEEFDKDVDEEFDKDVDEEFDKDVDEEFDKDVNEGFVKDIDEELDQEIEEQEQLTAALLSQYSKESDEEYEDEEEEEVDFDEEKSSETYMDRGDAGLEPLEETRPENQLELIPEQSPDSDLAKYVTDTTDVEEAHVSQDMGAETVEVEIPTKVVDFEDKEFKEEEVGMAFEKYETEPEIVVPIGAVIGENAEIEVCDIDKAFEKYETEPEIVVPIDAVMGEHAEIEVCDIDKAFEKYETEPEIVVPIDAVIGEHAEIEVCDIDKAFEKYETEPEIVVPIDAVIGEHAEIEVCDIDKAFEKYETEPEIVVPIDAVIGEHAEIEVSDIDKAFEKYETEPEIVVPIDAVIGEHAEIEVCDINQVFEKYEHEAEVPVPIGARVEHSHIEQEYEERGEFEANLEEPERSTVTEYEDRTSFQDKVSIAVIIDEVMGEPEEDSEVDQERFEKHEDESEADHDRFEKHEDEIEVDHDRFEKHDDESEADHDRFEIHEYETEVDHDRFEIHEYQTEVDHDRFEKHEDESKVDHDRFEKHEDESEADHDRFEKHEDESEADHDRFEKHEDESEADHDRFEKHEDESEADHDRFEKHEDESEVDHDRFEKHESEVDHDRFEKHESEVDHERFENYEDESEEDHETLEKHEEPHMLPSFETEVLLIKDGERFSEDDLTQERHEAQVDSAEVQHTEMGHGDGAHDEDQLDIMYQVTEMTKEEVAEEAGDEEDFISDSYIDKPRDEVVIEEREILQMLQHEVTDRTVSAEVTHLTDQEEMKAMEMEYEVELSKAIVQEALHTSIETTRRTDEERETGDQPQSSSGIMAEMQMLEDQQAEEELISEDDLDDDKYGEEAEEETYDQMIEMVPHEDDALRAEIDLGHKEHASTLEVTEIGDDQTEVYSELEQSIDRTEMKLEKVDISITEEATHALDRKESKLEETADQLDGERLEGSTEEVEFFIDQVQTVHQEAAIDICSLSAVQAREATESSLLQEENETEDNEFNKKYFIQAQEIDTKLEAPYTDSDTQEIDTDQAETFIDRSERFLETLQDVIIPEQDEKDRLATPYTSLGAAGEPHEESPSHTGSEASPTSQQATGDYDGSQATIDGMNMGLHLPRSPFYPTSSTEVHDRSGSPSDLEDEITEVEVKLSERKQIESFEEESQEEEFQEAFSQPQEETTLTRSGQEKPEMPGHTFMASSISGSDYTSPSDAEYAQSETTGTGSFYTAPSERMSSSSCTAQSETMTGSEYTMTASDYDHEADEEEYESEGRLSADISQQIFIEHKFSRRHGDQDVSSSDEEYEEGVDHLDRPPSPSEFTLIASQDTERLSISLGLTTQGGSRVLPQHTISPLAMENVQPHQDSVHFDTDIEKDSLQDEEEVHEDYDEDEDEDEEAEPEEDDGGRMSVDFATSERPPSPSDFTLIASQDQESLQRILNAEETLSPEQETGSPMQWEQDLEKAIIDADAMSTASSDQALMIGLDRISVTGTDNNTMSGVSSESGHQVDGESPLEDDVEDRQHLYQAYMREMESERLALAEEELREKVWSLSRSEEFSAETFEDVPRGGRDDDIVYDMYEDHVQSQMSLQEKEDSKDTLNLEVGYISPQAHFDDISQEEIQGQVTKFEEGVLVPAEEAGVSGKVDDDSTETKEQTHVEYGHTKVEVTERALVSGTSEIEDERDTESSWFSEEKQDMISTHVKYSYTYEEKQEIRSSEEAFKHTSLREEVESSSEYKVSSLTSHSESKSCLEFQLEPGHHLAQHDQQAEKRFDEQGQEMAAMALQASDKMSSSSSEVAQLDDFDNQDVEIREVSEETSEETDVEDQFSPVLTETAEPAFSFEVSSIGLSDEKVKRVQSSNLSPVAVKGQQEMVLKSYTEKKHAVTSQEVTETVHGEVDSVCGVALDAATENVEQEAQDVEVSSDYEAVKKHFEPVEVIDVDSGANLHEQVELTEEHEIDEEVEDIDDTELEPELCGLSHSDDHEVDGDEEEDEVEEEEIIEHEIESEESGEFIEGEDEFREDEQEEGIIEMEVCTAYENMAFRDEEVPEWTEETFPVKSELVRQETRDISPEDLEEKPFTYDFPDDFMQEMTFQDHYERTYTESVNIAADREVLQSFTVAQKIVSHADIQESWEDAVEEEVEEEAATDDRWEPSDDIGGQHMSKHVADMTSVDAADEPEAAGGNEIQVEEEEDSEVSSKSSSDSGGVEVFDEQTGQYTRLPWEIAHQYKRQFSESFAEEQKSAVKPQKSIDMGTFYRRDKSKDEEFLEKSFYSESDPLDSDSVAKRKVTFELEQEDVLGTTEPECEPEYFVAEHARPHPCEPYEQIDDTHDVDVLVTILESRQHVRSEIAKQVYDQEFPETPKQDTEFDMVARIRTVHSEFDMPSEFDMVVRTRSIPSEFDESEEDAMLLYQRSSEERHYISEHRSEMISVVSKESRMAQQELLLQESLDEEDRSLSPSRESCSKKLSTTFEEILPQTTPAHPTDFPMAVHSIGKSLADNEIYESSETERDSTEDKLSPIEETPGIDEIEEDDTTLKSTPPVEKKVTFQTDHLTPRVSEQSTDDFKASSSSSELSVEPTLLAASYDLDSGNVCHVVTAYDISPDTVEKQGPIEIAGKSILSSPEDDVFETDALSPHKATALSPEGPLIPRGHLLSGIDVCPSPPILIAPVSTPREGSEKEDLSSSLQTASTILEMLTHGERMDSKDGEDTTLQDDDMSSPQEEAATNDLKSDEGSLELEFPVDVRFAEATVFSEAKENGFGIHYEETEVFEEEYVNGVVEVDLMHDDHRRHVLNGPTEVDYIPEYDQGDDETLPVIMDRPEDVGQPVPLIYESNLIEVDTASFLETRLDVQQPEEEQAGVHDGTEEPEQPTVVTSSQAKPDVQQPTKDDEDDHEQPDGEKRIQPSFVSCIQAKPDIQQPTKDDDDDNDGDRPDGEKRIQPSFVSCVQAKPDIQQPTKDDDDDNDGDRPDGEKRIQPSFVSCVQAKPDIQQPTKDDDDDNDGDRPDGEKRIQPSFVSCVQAKPDIQQPTKDDDDDNDGDRPDGEKRIQPSFVSCVQAKPDIQQPTKDDDDDNDGDQPDGEKRLQPFYVSYVHAKPDIRHPEDSGSPLEVEGLVQPVASATVQAKPDIQQSQGDEPDGEDLIQPTIMITSQAKPDIRQPEDDKDNGYPVVEAPIQPTVTTGGQLRQEEQPITSRHSMTGSESGLSLTEVEQEGIQSSYAADDEEFTRHTEHEISITRFSPERDEEEDLDQRMYLFSKETVYHGKRALESIADTTFSEVYEEREEALVEGYAMSGEPMLQDEPALQEGDDELELEEEEEFEERPEEELIRLEEPTAESDEEEEEEEESADMREEEEAREHSYSVISTGLSSTELLCISSGSQSDLDRPLSPTPDALRQGFWGGNFTPPQSGMYTPPITGAFTPPQTSQEQSGDDSTVLEKTAVTFVDSVLEDVKVKVSSQATTPEEITEEEFRKGYESEVNITIDKSPDQQTTSPEQAVAGDDYEYAQPDMSSEIVRKRGVTLVKQISEDIPGIILTQHLHEEVNEDEYYGYSPQPESIPEDEEDRYLKEIAKMVQEEDDEFSEVTVVVAQKDEVMQQACSFEDVKLETSESPPAVEFLTEDILPLTPSAPEMERESASYTEEHHFLVKSDPGSSFAFSEPVHTSSEHEGQLYVNSELESGSFDELEMLEPVLSPEDHADSSSLDSFATVVAAEADEDEEYEPDENRLAEIASMTSSFTSDIQVSFPDEYRKESAEDFGDTEDDDLSLERSQEWLSTTPDDKDRESDASNDSDKFEFVDRAALSVITEMSDEDKFEMIEREDLESEAGLSDHFGSSPDTNVQQSPGITNLRFFGRGAERDDASISSSLAEFEKLEKAIPISSSLSSIERGDGDRDSFGGSYDERKFVGFRKLKEGEEATSIASSLAEFEQLEQALVVSGSASSVEKHTPESKSSGGSGENTSNSVASSLADFERFEQECQGDSDEKKSSVESSSRPSEASSCTSLNEFERLEREIAVAAELEVEAQKIVSILESGVLMECAKFGSADFSEAAGEDEREEKDSVEDDGREEMDHDSLSEEARLGHEEDADSLDGESSEVTEMASSVVFAGPDLALSQAVPADFDTDSLQGEALMQLSSDSLVLEQRLKSSDSTRFDTDSLFDKDDRMVQSGDSLELGGQSSGGHSSEKQEDIIIAGDDIMQTSADSLEFDNSKEEAKDSEGKDQQQQDDSVMMVSVESAAWSMGSSGGTGHSLSESHTDSSHSHDIMQVSTDSDIVKSGARPEKISLLSEQLFASELAAAKEIHHFEQSHQWHQAETSVHHVTSSSSQQHQSVSESKTKPKRESPKFAEYEEPEKEGLHTPKYRDFFTEAQWEVMKQAEREKQETETKSSALSSSSPELSQESDRDEKQSPPSQPHLDMQPSQQTSMTYISTSTTTTSYYRGADYQGFGDEDVQTHRVVMKKEVHKRTMLGEDGQEETLVREESHIQQDDEPPEELQESMQEIIRQFMESEPEPRPVPEHQSLEDDV